MCWATALGAKGCQNVVASCGTNVVSSRGCEVAKKSYKINAKVVITATMWDILLQKRKHGLFSLGQNYYNLELKKNTTSHSFLRNI